MSPGCPACRPFFPQGRSFLRQVPVCDPLVSSEVSSGRDRELPRDLECGGCWRTARPSSSAYPSSLPDPSPCRLLQNMAHSSPCCSAGPWRLSVFYGVWESADPRRLIYRLCSPLVTMALLSWSGGCFCFVTTSCVSFPMFGSFTDTEESRSWACFKGEKERPPARICVWLGAGRLLSRGVWAGSPGPGRGSWKGGQNTQSPDDARLEEPRAESHPVGPALPQISFSRHLTAFCPKPPGERRSFSPGQPVPGGHIDVLFPLLPTPRQSRDQAFLYVIERLRGGAPRPWRGRLPHGPQKGQEGPSRPVCPPSRPPPAGPKASCQPEHMAGRSWGPCFLCPQEGAGDVSWLERPPRTRKGCGDPGLSHPLPGAAGDALDDGFSLWSSF